MSDTGNDAQPYIADFGLAIKLENFEAIVRQKVGTQGYMAPEVITRQPYSKSCDVWSLGCMTYWLLTGQLPFKKDENGKAEYSTLYSTLDLSSID